MIAVLILAVVALAVLALVFDRALSAERARVNDLLTLLESKAAPAEHAAWVAATEPAEPEHWTFTTDGLIGVRTEEPEFS